MESEPLLNTAGCGALDDPAVTVCGTPSLLNQFTMVPRLTSRSSKAKSSIFEEMIVGLEGVASGVGDGGVGVEVTGADVAVGTGLDVGSVDDVGSAAAVLVLTTGVSMVRAVEVGTGVAVGVGLGGAGIAVACAGDDAGACTWGVDMVGSGTELEQAATIIVSTATIAINARLGRDGIGSSVICGTLLGGTQSRPIRVKVRMAPGFGPTSSRGAELRPGRFARVLNLIRSDNYLRFSFFIRHG